MTNTDGKNDAQRFLEFHQIIFRAQAYNRAFFLDDLAEDFLLAEHSSANANPIEIKDVEDFLKAYNVWEKAHFDNTKTGN